MTLVRRRFSLRVFLILVGLVLVLAVGLYCLHVPLLNQLGQILVQQDPLRPADAITVIPGPGRERMRTGIRLFKSGFAEKMVLSGPWPHSLVRTALNAGVPSSRIVYRKSTPKDYLCPKCSVPISGTAGDAQVIVRMLQESGMDSIIVVTSDYHSARTASAFRQLLEDGAIELTLQPTQEQFPNLQGWWRDRNSAWLITGQLQKTLFSLLSEQLPDCLLHPLQDPLSEVAGKLQSLLLPQPDFTRQGKRSEQGQD